MTNLINLDDYTGSSWDPDGLTTAVVGAFALALLEGEVAYVSSRGRYTASIGPVVMGERYEHAAQVEVQARQQEETIPGMIRRERRRRRWAWRGPFEGVF